MKKPMIFSILLTMFFLSSTSHLQAKEAFTLKSQTQNCELEEFCESIETCVQGDCWAEQHCWDQEVCVLPQAKSGVASSELSEIKVSQNLAKN